MNLISKPFGWVMWFCYEIVNNYGLALILFTLFTKLILFPLSIKQQKNTARTQALAPKLEKLKKKCGNNKQKYNEEMMRLYQEENINPMSGCLPLLIQMPILMGLYYVIYAPLTHILRLSKDTINAAQDVIVNNVDKIKYFADINANKNFDSRPQLYIVDAIQKHPEAFANSDISASALDKIKDFDYSFFGLNLGDVPSWGWNILILIPLLSFLTNLGYTFYTQHMMKKNNPSANQMGMGMNAMLYIMPIISAVFTFQFPAGVGIYWIISTVFSFFQTMLLYKIYSPARVAAMDAKKGPKKKKKKSMYERMMEAQQAQQNGGAPVSTINDDDDTPEGKLSKSAAKELQRQRLNEARRRMAEKYGDSYEESAD